MDAKELGSIKGWFAGRLPDGWFKGVEVTIEDDQIVVLGTLMVAGYWMIAQLVKFTAALFALIPKLGHI